MTEGIKFELNIINRDRLPSAPDPAEAKRRADRESGRQQAQVFAAEALLAAVSVMRNSKDVAQVLKASKLIMDRAWGIPKSASDEEAQNRNQSVIEILANMSAGFALEDQRRGKDIADVPELLDITPTPAPALGDLYLDDVDDTVND